MVSLQMIEVGIGLALIYFLLSLIVTAINEGIAQIWEMRAATLKTAIKQMLIGEYEDQIELAAKFYDHSLIKGLFRQGTFDKAYNQRKKTRLETRANRLRASKAALPQRAKGYEFTALDGRGGPSYIPSATFAKAIISLLKPETRQAESAPVTQKLLGELFTDWLKRRLTADTPPSELDAIRATVEKLPEHLPARQALLTLIDDAQGSLDRFEANLEAWFNTTMERVSGWYKRKLQLITLIVATVVTLALNVDTITLANALYRDPTLREAVVTAAEKRVEATKEVTVQNAETVSMTLGNASAMTITTTISPTATSPLTTTAPLTQIDQYLTELSALRLPIGWPAEKEAQPLLIPQSSLGWLSKVGGWLLTILSLNLGASFWFDMLNKLVNLRNTGQPTKPEPAPTATAPRRRSR